MMGGITPIKNQGNFATVSLVKKAVPLCAKPSKLRARLEMKAKISYPALDRSTNTAMTNWVSMPPMTVCHAIYAEIHISCK